MEKKDFPKGTKPREIFVYTCDLGAELDYLMGNLVCMEIDCWYKVEVGGLNG